MTGGGFVAATAPITTVPPATLSLVALPREPQWSHLPYYIHRKHSILVAIETTVMSFQFLFHHS